MSVAGTLKLRLADAGVRRSLSEVLAPDNEGLPKGLTLSAEGSGDTLVIRVESESAAAVLSTVLSLLRDTVLFQEVWLLSRTRRA